VLIFTCATGLCGLRFATPDKLQTALVVVQEFFFLPIVPDDPPRGGALLMGHLYSTVGYTTNAVKNAVEFYPLSDKNRGRDRASLLGFDKPKESKEEPVMMVPEDVPSSVPKVRGLLLEEQSVFLQHQELHR
jgi:hypothetical protein